MTHPPIPPNCEWFFKETMQKGTFGFELGDDDWWPLTDEDFAKLESDEYPKGYWRRKIAAVARCAWLDAALKLSNDTFERKEVWRLSVRRLMRDQWTNEMCAEEIALGTIEDQELQMKYVAEAWRLWGLT